jgi:sugar phosphate isomerase/epimerase
MRCLHSRIGLFEPKEVNPQPIAESIRMDHQKPLVCLKNVFPFKIGTTSFIYPDTYAQNTRALAPFFDEIELLFLQSIPLSCLPDKNEIRILTELKHQLDIGYNVHLPSDIDLGHPEEEIREHATEVLKTVFNLSETLSPSTYTLHLPFEGTDLSAGRIEKWRQHIRRGLARLTAQGIVGSRISIETLSYPLEWLEDIILEFDLRICCDIGHLMVFGFEISSFFQKFQDRVSIIHLHGVDEKKDHLGLEKLTDDQASDIADILRRFTEIVSIEVFSFENLASSLNFFGSLRAAESLISNSS